MHSRVTDVGYDEPVLFLKFYKRQSMIFTFQVFVSLFLHTHIYIYRERERVVGYVANHIATEALCLQTANASFNLNVLKIIGHWSTEQSKEADRAEKPMLFSRIRTSKPQYHRLRHACEQFSGCVRKMLMYCIMAIK